MTEKDDIPHGTTAPERRQVLRLLIEGAALVVAVALVPVVALVDITILGDGIKDAGLTETLQVVLVALSALMCGWGVRHLPEARGHLWMLTTLFTWMMIRENDSFLDQIFHGLWVYPATVVLCGGGYLVWRNRATYLTGTLRHANCRPGAIMIVGLVLLIFFSRLFGTGALWEAVTDQSDAGDIKTVVQETTELLAYVLIAFGAVTSRLASFGQRTL